jgi:PPOX class probable F420-dependent enzyme
MREMTRAQWWEFASAGTQTGKLGVVKANGSAHVTPIWFLLNETDTGDELIFNTGRDTIKGRALRRDPRVSLCVDEARLPYSFVQFTAEAELSENLDEMLMWATKIAARYMGAAQAESFGRRNAVPGEYLVRAKITKVLAQADVAE